jgi:hypothetical protein
VPFPGQPSRIVGSKPLSLFVLSHCVILQSLGGVFVFSISFRSSGPSQVAPFRLGIRDDDQNRVSASFKPVVLYPSLTGVERMWGGGSHYGARFQCVKRLPAPAAATGITVLGFAACDLLLCTVARPTCFPLPDNETCKLKQSLGLCSPSLSGLAAALERAVTTVGRGSRYESNY